MQKRAHFNYYLWVKLLIWYLTMVFNYWQNQCKYLHTYIHTYIHAYTVCMCVCMHVSTRMYMHACVCVWANACVCTKPLFKYKVWLQTHIHPYPQTGLDKKRSRQAESQVARPRQQQGKENSNEADNSRSSQMMPAVHVHCQNYSKYYESQGQ